MKVITRKSNCQFEHIKSESDFSESPFMFLVFIQICTDDYGDDDGNDDNNDNHDDGNDDADDDNDDKDDNDNDDDDTNLIKNLLESLCFSPLVLAFLCLDKYL